MYSLLLLYCYYYVRETSCIVIYCYRVTIAEEITLADTDGAGVVNWVERLMRENRSYARQIVVYC